MERLTSDGPIPEPLRGGVVALGNFDGFHRGHQAVAARARARAAAEGRPFLIATFDPHPVRYFRPDAPPFQITMLDQRETLFAEAGADAMLVFRFDDRLAQVEPDAFVAEWLVDRAGAAVVVTGQDFTFGRLRAGDVAQLRALGAALGLDAEAVAAVADGHGAVSSSRVREALRRGECDIAEALLTRPFAVRGRVQHGDKLGRTIGYPTANLALGDYVRPAYGIYAVRARLADGRVVDGAANLGIRPSFDPPKELLEPYLFDFSGDLYGQEIEIELVSYLRPEAKFDSLDALTAQMDADCAEARRRLGAGA